MRLGRSLAALFGCIAFACVASGAQAADRPIPGVDVSVKNKPAGAAIAGGRTDANGQVVLEGFPAGKQTIVLSGRSLDEVVVRGGTNAVFVIYTGTRPPLIVPVRQAGATLEADITISDEDARAKAVRLNVMADVPASR